MKNKNIYKPRYKIAFQAKQKNWIYKNCRMRRFFNIRGRKIQRRGYFKRIVLVLNTIKWTVARRYIKPYSHKRQPGLNKKRYRLRFYTKQLIRNFYGKVKETAFQQFLRNYLVSVKKRNNSFFAALERRLDMVIFRMKFLPTIFACNQLIHHYGICLNEQIQKSPGSIVAVGDMIALPNTHRLSVVFYLRKLIWYRAYGAYIKRRRDSKLHLKKVWWLKKARTFKSKNFSLIRKKFKVLSYINNIKKELCLYTSIFKVGVAKGKELKSQLKKKRKVSLTKLLMQLNPKQTYNETANSMSFLFYKIIKLFASINDFLKKLLEKRGTLYKNKHSKWRWKKQYSFFFQIAMFNFNTVRSINYLWMRLRLEEIRAQRNFLVDIYSKANEVTKDFKNLNGLQKIKNYQNLMNFLSKREALVLNEYRYTVKALVTQYSYVIRKKIKQKIKKKNKERATKNMIHFLIKRKEKQKRLRMAQRLRPYHFYVPQYLEIDWETMTGMLITMPKNNEIYFPFRCNLRQIYSYYRSRGY